MDHSICQCQLHFFFLYQMYYLSISCAHTLQASEIILSLKFLLYSIQVDLNHR